MFTSTLGQYRLEGAIGAGGMGVVYRAYDTRLQRPVAIKFLSGVSGDTARAKVLAEARAASALNHPNICTVYEAGEASEHTFIVMELVEGRPMSDLIPPEGFAPATVLRHAHQIADALAHAHRRGIVHRDLKAANVMITPEGRAKVLDFGVATALRNAEAEPATRTTLSAENTASVTGTLPYMAPEVLRGKPADVPLRGDRLRCSASRISPAALRVRGCRQRSPRC